MTNDQRKTTWYDDTPMMKSQDYEDGTRVLAHTLGRDADVEVVFAGDGASVDSTGKRIFLPANHLDKTMTRKQVGVSRGYVDHELGHKLCTQLDALKEIDDHYSGEEAVGVMRLANALEDVRIEQCMKTMYEGVADSINICANHAAKNAIKSINDNGGEAWSNYKQVAAIATTWAGRQRLGYDAPAINEAMDKLDPEVRDDVERLGDLAMALPTVEKNAKGEWDLEKSRLSTAEAVKLAIKLWDEMQEKDDVDNNPSAGKGESDEDGEGKGEENNAGLTSDDTGEGEDKGDGKDTGEGEDKGEEANAPSVGSQESDTDARSQSMVNPDMDASDVFQDLSDRDHTNWVPLTRHFDTWLYHKKGVHLGGGLTTDLYRGFARKTNKRDYRIKLDGITGNLAAMKVKLERAIMAHEDRFYEGGFASGRLNMRRPSEILTGRGNVYQRKAESQDINTAVSMVIDMSGSMSGSPIRLAQQATIALFECLDRTQVALEILGFTTDVFADNDPAKSYDEFWKVYSDQSHRAKSHREFHERYSRLDSLSIYMFKRFEDQAMTARQTIGGMLNADMSANNDGESVLAAWNRLKARPENNKVMLVLSDGFPSFRNGHKANPGQHLRDVIERIKNEGGNIVGIGIKNDAVQSYYPNYVVINAIEDLQKTALDQIARMLLGEHFTVDNSELLAAKNKRVA